MAVRSRHRRFVDDKIPVAMKDKIYVHIGDHFGLMFPTEIPVNAPGEQEFIRKDALLEMLNEAISILSDGGLTGYYESLAYQDIVEKINSL